MDERSPFRAWFECTGDEVTLPGGIHAYRTRAGNTVLFFPSDICCTRSRFQGIRTSIRGRWNNQYAKEKTGSSVDEGIQYCMNNRSGVETFRQCFETIDPIYHENGIYTILNIIEWMIV
jgi:hypothetical protein